MALQKFAWIDPGSNLDEAVKKVITIKFKLIMIILIDAKYNRSM